MLKRRILYEERIVILLENRALFKQTYYRRTHKCVGSRGIYEWTSQSVHQNDTGRPHRTWRRRAKFLSAFISFRAVTSFQAFGGVSWLCVRSFHPPSVIATQASGSKSSCESDRALFSRFYLLMPRIIERKLRYI